MTYNSKAVGANLSGVLTKRLTFSLAYARSYGTTVDPVVGHHGQARHADATLIYAVPAQEDLSSTPDSTRLQPSGVEHRARPRQLW